MIIFDRYDLESCNDSLSQRREVFARTWARCSTRFSTGKVGIVINKDGKPVAALVDADLFARIRRMRDRFNGVERSGGPSGL